MLSKNTTVTWLQRVVLFSLVLIFLPAFFVSAKSQATKPIVVRPSSVLGYLQKKIEAEPNIDPKVLAQIGNEIIKKKGFDYAFDACEIMDRNPPKPPLDNVSGEKVWDYSLTQVNGKKTAVKIVADEPGDGGMCGECFFWLPTRQVSDREMLLVINGIDYRFKRLRSFRLDTAWLMDSKMKKVLRTWQLPYQMGPLGISADGTKLYYHFYSEELNRVLVLELSEDGSTKFLARSEIDPQGEREFIEDYPKSKYIGDVYFVRFRVAGKSYIVQYDSPCT